MSKPLPMALRERIVETYDARGVTVEQVADRFRVGVSTVGRYLRMRREKGTLQPTWVRRGPPPVFSADRLEVLQRLLEASPDATNAELAWLFE